jgi:hypothetical protein
MIGRKLFFTTLWLAYWTSLEFPALKCVANWVALVILSAVILFNIGALRYGDCE